MSEIYCRTANIIFCIMSVRIIIKKRKNNSRRRGRDASESMTELQKRRKLGTNICKAIIQNLKCRTCTKRYKYVFHFFFFFWKIILKNSLRTIYIKIEWPAKKKCFEQMNRVVNRRAAESNEFVR